MIIHYLHVVSVSAFPFKTNPPLVIYADAVLTGSDALEHFKHIPRRDPQIIETSSPVQIQEFTPCLSLKRLEPQNQFIMKQSFHIFVFKGFYHYVLRNIPDAIKVGKGNNFPIVKSLKPLKNLLDFLTPKI